ncbi:MAG TPA: PKD domain-containing protein, partial [Anaeromyxobacteraceae bacterium]|nr:PKD domain-containing protein [Anaeromyxobacteraceae bacterium]
MAQDFVFLSGGLVVSYDHAAPIEAGSVLSAEQTALLNSLGQRLELGIAFVDPFDLSVESTVLYDENKREVMSAMPWHSIVRMSVQRIGLAGEAFRFYGGDSYARYGGAAGSSDADYVWTFGDGGTGIGASVSHTYAAPGQYEVTLSVPNCREPGRRRLRVLGDWSEGSTSVLEVRDLGASLQAGGWHATVRLIGDQESVPDRAGVIVYARD